MERVGSEIDRGTTDTILTTSIVEALSTVKLTESSKKLEHWTRALVGLTIVLSVAAILNAILTLALIIRT